MPFLLCKKPMGSQALGRFHRQEGQAGIAMPTYIYKCECGETVEVFNGMFEKPEVACPKCSGPMKKQISAGTRVIFRGPGFYETDYKRKGKSE